MGIRILSGGGFHDWIDDWRDRREIDGTGIDERDFAPMTCLHCGTKAWREKGTGRLQLLAFGEEEFVNPTPYLRPLKGPEKTCEYMIVKQIMEI